MAASVAIGRVALFVPRRGRVIGTAAMLATSLLSACGSGSDPESNTATSPGGRNDVSSPPATDVVTSQTLVSVDDPATAAADADRRLAIGGIELAVPDGWSVQRSAVIGTALEAEATECGSVEVVDSPSAPGAGNAASDRAAVQVCVLDRRDDLTLEQWLTQRGSEDWLRAQYGTCAVLRRPGAAERQLAYVQVGEIRAENSSVDTTTADMAEQRRAEVTTLLESARCSTG